MTKMAAMQLCSSHDLDENLRITQNYIQEAAKKGAKLIVLPENFAMMSLTPEEGVKYQEALGNGKIQTFLSVVAKKNKIWIVAGTIPIESQNPHKKYSTCLVYNDAGQCVGLYNKIHLFDVELSNKEHHQESATTERGSSIIVLPTPFGKLGLAVCYDLRFPELFRCLFNLGAEIIVLPAAFTVITGKAHWEVLTRARAIENQCFVIAANQTGIPGSGQPSYGHSMIVNPWGEMMARLDKEEGIVLANLDLSKLTETRQKMPVAKHRRL